MISNKIFILIIILLLTAYHFVLHNNIEKLFSQTYFDYNDIRRPLNICNKKSNKSNLSCIGMPSGHAEGFSVLFFLLYFYNFIPLWLCLIIIVLVSIQRITTNMHALNQVIVGTLLGLIYAIIYKYFKLSIYGFLVVLSIGFVLTLLTMIELNNTKRVLDYEN
jgi:membrane-associated phospholipid phosphatase